MLSAIAKPFGMLLMFLYEVVQNYGLAVILFAIAVKLILLPFQMKSKRGTLQTTRLQPKMEELKKKHGANQQKYNEELQKLYKDEGINPMSGCLWGLLPFPILIALYQAIRFPLTIMMGVSADLISETVVDGVTQVGAILQKLRELDFTTTVSAAYEQIAQSQFISQHFDEFAGITDKLRQIDYSFLGIDLGAVPDFKIWNFDFSDSAVWVPQVLLFLIPIVAGGLSLAQTLIMRRLQPTPETAEGQASAGSMKMMMYLSPLMSLYFAFIMPAALGIYWAAGSVLQIIQEIVLTKHYTRKMDAEDEVRNRDRVEREAELERKRLETERRRAENKTAVNPSTSKKKQELAEKKEREAKAAEWAKKNAPPEEEREEDPARVGNRKYARGRAYDPLRYPDAPGETASVEDGDTAEETPALPDGEHLAAAPSAEDEAEAAADTETVEE